MGRISRPREQPQCSFCGRPRTTARTVVAGPGGVYICAECVAAAPAAVIQSARSARTRCSFCGKPAGRVRWLFDGPSEQICDECIALAAEILADETIA